MENGDCATKTAHPQPPLKKIWIIGILVVYLRNIMTKDKRDNIIGFLIAMAHVVGFAVAAIIYVKYYT